MEDEPRRLARRSTPEARIIAQKNSRNRHGASDVLSGFRYQLMQSLAAWLSLREGEELWLEVSEDFSIATNEAAKDVQVKSSRAEAGPPSYSLQSKDVRAALSRFWDRQEQAPGFEHRLVFLAHGEAARERNLAFPENMPGLTYWHRAALDADTMPIRAALSSSFSGSPLGSWIDQNPTDEQLRNRLLRKVSWQLKAQAVSALEKDLTDQIAGVFLEMDLPATLGKPGFRALLDRVFSTAAEASEASRKLTRVDLAVAVEEVAAPTAIARLSGAATPPALDDTRHDTLVTDLDPISGWMARRQSTVKRILSEVSGQSVIWIHGPHGLGKSTLAKLLANALDGKWVSIDLTPIHTDPHAIEVAWRGFVRYLLGGARPDGAIVDALPPSAMPALLPRIASLSRTLEARGGRLIITSLQEPSPARVLEFDGTATSISAPYFSEDDVLELVRGPNAPEAKLHEAWAKLILVGTAAGHPLLVTAKIASFRARGWPTKAIGEAVDAPVSEATKATREEARRMLLNELAAFGGATSVDAGKILRRIACVYNRVDEGLARQLAIMKPTISTAGDAMALLKGTWLELLPGGDIRISPLLADIASDVPESEANRYRQAAAEYWLKSKVLDERTLPLAFWNAFLGKHHWAILKLCQAIHTLPRAKLVGAATLLSPIALFANDRPLFGHPAVDAHLRLLQFEVSDATEEGARAGLLPAKLLEEIDAQPHADIRALLTTVSAHKILGAQNAETPAAIILEYALRLRRVLPRVQELMGDDFNTFINGVTDVAGPRSDAASVLLATRIGKVRGSRHFLEFVEALNALPEVDRNSFIDGASDVFEGLSVLVHNGWVRDQLDGASMADALSRYEQATAIVKEWHRDDMLLELACARSVILDEGLDASDQALEVIDHAIATYGSLPILVRQKAKVLTHRGEDEVASNLLVNVEKDVESSPPFERALALREAGVAAARSNRFRLAVQLFQGAADAVADRERFVALRAGLITEKALAYWDDGEKGLALLALVDAFGLLENIDASANRQSERVHHVTRAVGGMFSFDMSVRQRDARPSIAYGQASALHRSDEPLQHPTFGSLADNLRLLALVEVQAGLDVGIQHLSESKQSSTRSASIETLIFGSRYASLLGTHQLDAILEAGLRASSSAWALLRLRKSSADPRATLSELLAHSASELMGQETSRELLLQLPLDVLTTNRFDAQPDPTLVDKLHKACLVAFGGANEAAAFFKAASGLYTVGASAPFAYQVANALALSEDDLRDGPSKRFMRDLNLVMHVARSFARRRLEQAIVSPVADGWAWVLENQQFLMRAPTRHLDKIEAAIARSKSLGVRGLAELLLAVAPAAGVELGDQWETALKAIR